VQYKHEWQLSPDQLEAALEFVASLPRWPAKYLAPVLHSIAFDFRLREPRTGVVLPGQTAERGIGSRPVVSGLMLHLGGSPTASLDLRFPFENPDRAFLDYIASVLPFLPISLAWNRFRLMVPNQRGTGYAAHKLEPALFDGLRPHPRR
jgi:hypothetical protein